MRSFASNGDIVSGDTNRILSDKVGPKGSHRVVPVYGKSGSGKSHAISDVLAASSVEAVHFRARRDHATLIPFARALVDALEGLAPSLRSGFSEAALAAARAAQPAKVLGDWLADRLGTTHAVIAVDDLHLVDESAPVRDFIIRIVASSGPRIRWIVAARETHLWPLATWLAHSTACVPVEVVADSRREPPQEWLLRASLVEWTLRKSVPTVTAARALALLPALDRAYLDRLQRGYETLEEIAKAFPFTRSGDRFVSSFSDALLAATSRYDAGAFAAASLALVDATPAARLQFFTALDAREDIVEALDRDGFAMLERGEGDIVDEAIRRLSAIERHGCALPVALEAKREMRLGRHDVGEAWYLHAASIAGNADDRARVEFAHASDLLRRSRFDAIEMLERITSRTVSQSFDAMAAATLAAAYAATDRPESAHEMIEKALSSVATWPETCSVNVRALVYRQAAYVLLRDGAPQEAAAMARRAIAFAEVCAADDVIAAALSVLVVVAISHADDGNEALVLLAQLERCALRLDNAYLLRYSRLAQLDEYGERAMWPDVDRIESILAQQELENDARHADETLVRTRALRMAASGNFPGALGLLGGVPENAGDPELLALRHAESAVYAAAAGNRIEAKSAIVRAEAALRFSTDPGVNALTVRAILQLSLAELLLGDVTSAVRRTRDIEPAARAFPRMNALATAIEAVLAFDDRDADTTSMAMLDALVALHAAGLGGIAASIGALPLARLARRAS
jgi:tetratricopeptide (TPR) repeat protein